MTTSYAERIRKAAKKALEARAAYQRDAQWLDNPDPELAEFFSPSERARMKAQAAKRARDAIEAAREEARLAGAEGVAEAQRRAAWESSTVDPETRRAVRESLKEGVAPADILARARSTGRLDMVRALRTEVDFVDFSDAGREAMGEQLGAGGSDPRAEWSLILRRAEADLGDRAAQLEVELLQAAKVADFQLTRASKLDGETLGDVLREQYETGEAPWQPAEPAPVGAEGGEAP